MYRGATSAAISSRHSDATIRPDRGAAARGTPVRSPLASESADRRGNGTHYALRRKIEEAIQIAVSIFCRRNLEVTLRSAYRCIPVVGFSLLNDKDNAFTRLMVLARQSFLPSCVAPTRRTGKTVGVKKTRKDPPSQKEVTQPSNGRQVARLKSLPKGTDRTKP